MKDPMKEMVRWYDPGQLQKTAVDVLIATIFGRNSDPRLTEVFAFGEPECHDYRGAAEDGEFWFDFVGDVGDGWNSTYGVAYHLAQPNLVLQPAAGKGGPISTKRGQLLIIGGDLVYPTPTRYAYDRRFVLPYQTAFPPRHANTLPHLFAIPGNHDWYDSLVSFVRLFVNATSIGGWLAPQTHSYFALRLPFHWWLLGADLQLGAPIDKPQVDFFVKIAQDIQPDDGVIVCVHEPDWLYRKMEHKYDPQVDENNLAYLQGKLGRKVNVFVAGDYHAYFRHENEDNEHKIVSGGGGAFLHPTHGPDLRRLPPEVCKACAGATDKLPMSVVAAANPRLRNLSGPPALKGTYHLQACYPPSNVSRRLCWRNLLVPFINWQFGILPAVGYLLTGWATKVERGTDMARYLSDPEYAVSTKVVTLLRDPIAVFWLTALFLGFWLFTDTRSKSFRFLMGTAHGLAHVLACLVLCWLSVKFAFHVVGLPYDSYDFPSQLLLSGAILFVGGWVVGSAIMGVYLLVSLNVFRKHWNESFSSLRVADYKNFLRFKITANVLTIYPVGLPSVPRRWRQRSSQDAADGVPSQLVAVHCPSPILIEERPVEVVRKTAAPVVPPGPAGEMPGEPPPAQAG